MDFRSLRESSTLDFVNVCWCWLVGGFLYKLHLILLLLVRFDNFKRIKGGALQMFFSKPILFQPNGKGCLWKTPSSGREFLFVSEVNRYDNLQGAINGVHVPIGSGLSCPVRCFPVTRWSDHRSVVVLAVSPGGSMMAVSCDQRYD